MAERGAEVRAPDVLGRGGRVQVLVEMLSAAQGQRFRLEAAMVANGQDPGDPAVGYPATRPDGAVNSYRLLLRELDEQAARLREAFPDEWSEVELMVARRDGGEGQ